MQSLNVEYCRFNKCTIVYFVPHCQSIYASQHIRALRVDDPKFNDDPKCDSKFKNFNSSIQAHIITFDI